VKSRASREAAGGQNRDRATDRGTTHASRAIFRFEIFSAQKGVRVVSEKRKSLFDDVEGILEARKRDRDIRRLFEWPSTLPVERDGEGRVTVYAYGWMQNGVCQFWWIEPRKIGGVG